MEGNIKNVNLRSEEINDMVNAMPNALIRYGSLIIFSIIFFSIIGSRYIEYSEILPAEITITTQYPPVKIVARTSGILSQVFVRDQQMVKKGEVLAVISNTAKYENVIKLKNWLNQENAELPKIDVGSLGELSQSTSIYFNSMFKRKLFESIGTGDKQIKALKERRKTSMLLKDKQLQQIKLLNKEVLLTGKDFERNHELFKNGVISSQEFEKKEKEYLENQRQLKVLDQNITATEISILNIDEAILEIQSNSAIDQNELINNEQANLRNLVASLAEWEKRYVLIATISGRLSYIDFWNANHIVDNNNSVFWIEPDSIKKIIGRVNLPLRKSGKVQIGQDVQIKLENYPYEEYGILQGKVSKIGLLPNQDFYSIEVEFPSGLISSYGRSIRFHQQMKGNANIITEELSLFDRVFYQFRKLFNSR